jgi:hypothetical protein
MSWLWRIWQFDRWIIKFVLFVVFWLVVGFPQTLVRNWHHEQESMPTIEERAAGKSEATIFVKDLVAKAEEKINKGVVYTPQEHYEGLKQFRLKCTELKIKGFSAPEIQQLSWLMQKQMIEKKVSNHDIEKAVADYKEFINPGRESFEELRRNYQSAPRYTILLWFFWLYLEILPLAFILYLVWIKDEHGFGAFSFPRPIPFIGLLLIYPIFIGKRWWRRIQESERRVRAEAELRRAQNIFSYLSKEDQEKIKQFAKSNLSIAEWKREISELGFRPRHSFAAALAVTLLFAFCIRPIEASVSNLKPFKQGNAALVQIEETQNLARSQIESDNPRKIKAEKQKTGFEISALDLCINEAVRCTKPLHYWIRLVFGSQILRSQFFRKIDHIPIKAACFECQSQIVIQF